MLTRRRFVIALGGSAVAAPLCSFAASPAVQRVAFVAADRRLATGQRMDALRAGLVRLGYVENKNIILEPHWPGKTGEPDHTLRDLAQALIDAQTDVIVAHGAAAALKIPRALRVQKSAIPLVMATCPDPVRYGAVANLARPDGIVTGLADAPDPIPGRLTLLSEAVPGLSRVAVLAHSQFPDHPNVVQSARTAALKSAISILPFQFRTPEELETAFREIEKAHAQAVLVSVDTSVDGAAEQVAARAIEHKMPTMFGARAQAEAGGLMSYSEDLMDTYYRAAIYADKLLKGARPAGLPISAANKFELTINRKTAAAINIKLPAALLARASRSVT